MKKVIFISQNYSFNPLLCHERAFKYSRYVLDRSNLPLSPVLLFHGVASNHTEYDKIIGMCKRLILCSNEFWEFDTDMPPSRGRQEERNFAEEMGIPLVEVEWSTLGRIRQAPPITKEEVWRKSLSAVSRSQLDLGLT